MKICILTDAWSPQVNGVVRTLKTLRRKLRQQGHSVLVIHPGQFETIPCPGYKEIRLSLNAPFRLAAMLDCIQADAFHIATEGPIGWLARRYFMRRNIPYTTAYHTDFPQYLAARLPIKVDWIYSLLKGFHNAGHGCLVATDSIAHMLQDKGFQNIIHWGRGVDTKQFSPVENIEITSDLPTSEDPIHLYVGRVAVEKNLSAFLDLTLSGPKVVVGDGPALSAMKRAYPDVYFMGTKFGDDLRAIYAAADVFVFPSKTDTFGLVMIEALACGTPVAAFPVQGPLDIIGRDGTGTRPLQNGQKPPVIGALNDDLKQAIDQALKAKPEDCITYAQYYDWDQVTEEFLTALVPVALSDTQMMPAE